MISAKIYWLREGEHLRVKDLKLAFNSESVVLLTKGGEEGDLGACD